MFQFSVCTYIILHIANWIRDTWEVLIWLLEVKKAFNKVVDEKLFSACHFESVQDYLLLYYNLWRSVLWKCGFPVVLVNLHCIFLRNCGGWYLQKACSPKGNCVTVAYYVRIVCHLKFLKLWMLKTTMISQNVLKQGQTCCSSIALFCYNLCRQNVIKSWTLCVCGFYPHQIIDRPASGYLIRGSKCLSTHYVDHYRVQLFEGVNLIKIEIVQTDIFTTTW